MQQDDKKRSSLVIRLYSLQLSEHKAFKNELQLVNELKIDNFLIFTFVYFYLLLNMTYFFIIALILSILSY